MKISYKDKLLELYTYVFGVETIPNDFINFMSDKYPNEILSKIDIVSTYGIIPPIAYKQIKFKKSSTFTLNFPNNRGDYLTFVVQPYGRTYISSTINVHIDHKWLNHDYYLYPGYKIPECASAEELSTYVKHAYDFYHNYFITQNNRSKYLTTK